MKKVLVVNSSIRSLNSHSRKLTEVFTTHWKKSYDNPVITYRELGNEPVSHISENWVNATQKPEKDRSEADNEILKSSNTYISELREADIIVLGVPMYNWSVPSALKAYIDQVFRFNETFTVNPENAENPYVGLLENKTMVLLLSRGASGYEKGESNGHLNFQSTYLKTVFGIMGIHNVHQITVDGASFDQEVLKKTVETAHQNVRDLIDLKLI